jgi:hypothetical protein
MKDTRPVQAMGHRVLKVLLSNPLYRPQQTNWFLSVLRKVINTNPNPHGWTITSVKVTGYIAAYTDDPGFDTKWHQVIYDIINTQLPAHHIDPIQSHTTTSTTVSVLTQMYLEMNVNKKTH